MARAKNPLPQLPNVSVGPPTETLKGLFEANNIPLETSYAELIDVADCGRRATGQSPNFPAALNTGLELNPDRQLSVKPDMEKGVVVGARGVSVVPGTAVTVGDNGIGIVANQESGIGMSSSGIRVVVNEDKGLAVDAGGLRIKEGFRSVPVGAIAMWPSRTPPEGWLLCEGATFETTLYPQLASVLGGGTLPNFRGQYPCGADGTNPAMTQLPARTGVPDGFSLSDISNDPGHSHSYRSNGIISQYDFSNVYDYPGTNDQPTRTSDEPAHQHIITLTYSFNSTQSRPVSIGTCFIIAHD